MLQKISSVFIVYRRKTLTGSPDPTHAIGTDKPCKGLYPPMLEEGPAVLQVEPDFAENIIPAAVVDVVAEIKPSGTDNIVPKDTTMSDEKERKKARKAEKRARKRAKKAKKEAAKLAKENEFLLQSFYS